MQIPCPQGAEPIAKQLTEPLISVAMLLHADMLAMMQFLYSGNVFVVQHLHELIGSSNNEAYLPEDMLALLASGKYSDLTLRAEGSEFRVHKVLLLL